MRLKERIGDEKRHEKTKAEQWRGFQIRQEQRRQNETAQKRR